MAENKSEFEFEGQNDNYQNNNEIQQVNNTGFCLSFFSTGSLQKKNVRYNVNNILMTNILQIVI
jgi:hypothetical protein